MVAFCYLEPQILVYNSTMKKIYPLFLFIFSLIFVNTVSAQESINNFDTAITAQKDGRMFIEEEITYDFGEDERHGIYRYIPLISQVGDLYRVIDIEFQNVYRNGIDEPYEIDQSSDQIEVKIGDADRTITGVHTYTIEYVVSNGIGSNYTDHDEIYWNVTGNGWDVPIASTSVTLTTDFQGEVGEVKCFTGIVGSAADECTVVGSNAEKVITTTGELQPNEGMTFVASFPVNTFPKSTLQKNKPVDPDVKLFLFIIIPILIFLNFIVAPFLVLWYFKNHTKKKYGSPVVNFDLPKDEKGQRITPAEAGTIDSTKLDKNDIIATIFDLAIRKYLRIEGIEEKKKILSFGQKEEYRLVKLKEGVGLNSFEKTLFDNIFATADSVLLSDVTLSYTTFQSLEKANFSSLIDRGMYTKNPAIQMGVLMGIGIAALATFNWILGPVLLFLSRMMNGRTQEGVHADWKVDGLKIFLKGTNRYNAWQAKNILTLEKMIPYAVSLGMINEFMKELKVLKPDYKPTWYRGSGNFYGSYPHFMSTMSSDITTSAPSSSSGFSGGSSGGGGGGGGGGSW